MSNSRSSGVSQMLLNGGWLKIAFILSDITIFELSDIAQELITAKIFFLYDGFLVSLKSQSKTVMGFESFFKLHKFFKLPTIDIAMKIIFAQTIKTAGKGFLQQHSTL